MEDMKEWKTTAGFVLSALLPVVLFLIIFMGPDITQGNNTVLVSDLNGQYVNYFLYFKEAVARGDDLFYSFSMLLGGDTLSLIGYYLLSPLNFILLLWPAEKIASGIFAIITIKVGLAGLTSYLYFFRKRGVRFSTLIFSTTYALAGYVFAYFMHVMWLDALYLLPLVIMGLELLVEKKNRILYILSLAAAIIICYYTGYMIAGFSLLYFIYLQISEKYPLKDRIRSIVTFVWTSILAAAMSAVTLIPVLLSQTGNRQAQAAIKYGILHDASELLSKFFTGAYNVNEFASGAPQIYCGVLMLFLVILFFVSAKGNIRKIIAAGALLITLLMSFSVGALDIVWHGLAMPNSFTHRFAFVFIFAFLIFAEECFTNKKITLQGIITADGITLALIVWVWFARLEYVNSMLLLADAGIVVAVSALFYIYKNGTKENRLIMAVLLLIVQAAQLLANGRIYVGIHTYDDHSSEGYYSAVKPIVEEVQAIDDGFYRMEKMYFNSPNDAMMFFYNGLSHFSSADKSYIRGFMGSLGYNKNYDFWVYYDKGATLAADSLLGVKYIISEQPLERLEEKESIGNQIIYENPLALEIGTVCSAQIKEIELNTNEPFVNQEKIYNAMYGEKTGLFVPYEAEIFLNNIHADKDGAYVKMDGEKDGIIIFEFTAKNDCPIYMYLPSEYNPGVQVLINGEDKGEYLTTYHRGVFEIGTFAEGEHIAVELYLHGAHAGFSDVQIYGLDIERLAEIAGALKGQGWTVTEYNSANVKAECYVEEEDSVLFITVPYNENWEITVDGAPAAVTEVLDALIAVDVSKGAHVIKMHYQPGGLLPAGIISLAALIIFLVVAFADNKKRKNDTEPETRDLVRIEKEEAPKQEGIKEETTKEVPVIKAENKIKRENSARLRQISKNAEWFLNKQYGGGCQICGRVVTEKDGSKAWSVYSLFERIEDEKAVEMPIAWDKICLCPICKVTFAYSEISMKDFCQEVMEDIPEGGEKTYRFRIRIQDEEKHISYSAEHLQRLRRALESGEGKQLREKFRYK